MAKELQTDPVTADQIQRYILDQNDFAFELSIIPILHQHHFKVVHGGTYDDPGTGLPRQFDLRARRIEKSHAIRLAAECKHLGRHHPLIVLRVQRPRADAFHQLMLSTQRPDPTAVTRGTRSAAMTVTDGSLYRSGEYVGRSTDQIGFDKHGIPVGGDKEVYGKWAQAIASAYDLIQESMNDSERENRTEPTLALTLPVLVVPDGTLWTCDFDADGKVASMPELANRCSIFIDKRYAVPTGFGQLVTNYRLTHMEAVTPTGLQLLLAEIAPMRLTDSTLFELFDYARRLDEWNIHGAEPG